MISLKKIESHLSSLLDKANAKFSLTLSESTPDPNIVGKTFQDCAQGYERIMNLIEPHQKNNTCSDLLKFYYLKAWLYNIQSRFNALPQNPPDENSDIVLSNEDKIKKLSKSLQKLVSRVENINLFHKKKIPSPLKEDCNTLKEEIKNYFNSWDENVAHRKAVYTFNTAESLAERARKQTISKNSDGKLALKKINLEMALACLELSKIYYKKAKRTEDAKSISPYKIKINKELSRLKKLSPPISPRSEISAKPKKSLTINHVSKPSNSPDPVAQKNQIEPYNDNTAANLHSNCLPLKKRKLDSNYLDAREPAGKKAYISPAEINITIDPSLNAAEKILAQKINQYEKILTAASIDWPDRFKFYGQLFFMLSQQLQLSSSIKEALQHILLSKLSWLTLANELMHLTSNKNALDNTVIKKIATEITHLSTSHQNALDIIRSQKRAEAYPTFTTLELKTKDLKKILIKEITDYYHGLAAFNKYEEAESFLNLIANVIKPKPGITIEARLRSVAEPTDNLFFATLLRELIKFHICDENEAWRKKTFLTENSVNLNNEYWKILIITKYFAKRVGDKSQDLNKKILQLEKHLLENFSPEKNLTLSDNTIPSSAFFQLAKQIEPVGIELCINTLQVHYQHLIEYKAPSIPPENIYNHLLQFIRTHCPQKQDKINCSRVSQG